MMTRAIADPPREQLLELAALHGKGQFEVAYSQGQSLAQHFPSSPSLSNILGVLAIGLGQTDAALKHLRRAIELKPDFHPVRANLGTLLRESGNLDEAGAILEEGLAIAPDHAALLAGLANVEAARGRQDEAIELFKRSIAANPREAETYNSLGHLVFQQGRNAEALAIFKVAIQLKPDFGEAHASLAGVLQRMGQLEAAATAFETAAKYAPNSAAVHLNMAAFYANVNKPEKAAEAFETVARLEPENLNALASSLYYNAMLCRWNDGLDAARERLAHSDFQPRAKQAPGAFVVMTQFDDPALQLRAASNAVAQVKAEISVQNMVPPPPGARIRLGYFSADFHDHATMHLLTRLFELHDRSRFELHAFSFAADHGDGVYRRRLLENIDHFHDVGELKDADIISLSRRLGIDIAIDLKGHTRDSRMAVFAGRAAPVQVNYLGYPGTCGSADWDYIVADRMIIPLELEPFYCEKLVAMPDSYQVNDDRRIISDRDFTRAECGLPESGFVFCCFNSAYKITPGEFDIWMRLLESVDGSVLWLLHATDTTTSNLRAEAAARGVDPARLVFADRMPLADHLARHKLADLFLDTFTVNAHTTASDALWSGLPVLTMAGKSFAARVSASLLCAVGLEELVTDRIADYEALALELAADRGRIDRLKAQLRTDPAKLPLFDTARYTRNLERAYTEMMSIYRAGEAPLRILL